jgi:hypothetical protein
METLLPQGSAQMRAVNSAAAIQEGLLQGIWTYPTSTVGPGHWNLSIIAFDIPFFVLLFLGGFLLMTASGARKKRTPKADFTDPAAVSKLMDYCTSGGPQGAVGAKWAGMSRYVAFFKLDQIINWVSVATLVAFVSFKIICGAAGVNASSILLVLIIGFMIKYFRQWTEANSSPVPLTEADNFSASPKKSPVRQIWPGAFMGPTLIALISTIITYVAYTDCIGTATKSGVDGDTHAGRQPLYIWAGIAAFAGMMWKMALTLSEDSTAEDRAKTHELFRALVSQEFMYYMTGWDCVVISIAIGTFVLTESVFVAYAATALYACPFYILLLIPSYFMVTNVAGVATNNGSNSRKVTIGPLFFNLLLSALAVGMILLAQMQVCSMPHPSKQEHVGKMCIPYGLHWNKDNDMKMREAPVILLGCITSLFLLLVMAGTQYTNGQIVRTVNEVCSPSTGEKV